MPALVAGIHALSSPIAKTWMAGTSPAMTETVIVAREARDQPRKRGLI
jgi:hypothetical protein